jgi:hypothetical protein
MHVPCGMAMADHLLPLAMIDAGVPQRAYVTAF